MDFDGFYIVFMNVYIRYYICLYIYIYYDFFVCVCIIVYVFLNVYDYVYIFFVFKFFIVNYRFICMYLMCLNFVIIL